MPDEEKYDQGADWRPPSLPRRIADISKSLLNFIEYLAQRLKPLRKHWYNSGVQTIATATTSAGTYEDVVNFITDLGYPATAGVVQNFGSGNLYFVISVQPDDVSGNETRLSPGQTFRWGGPDNPHQVYYLHLRADVANTDYQIIGGSGKLEITESYTKRIPPGYTQYTVKDSFSHGGTGEEEREVTLQGTSDNIVKEVLIFIPTAGEGDYIHLNTATGDVSGTRFGEFYYNATSFWTNDDENGIGSGNLFITINTTTAQTVYITVKYYYK